MTRPHFDTTLSNSHKDHQMCSEMQQGGKGEVSHTLPYLMLSPPFSPTLSPLLSPRDMCARCASRQFQLSTTDAQTAAVSPFPCSPNYSPSSVSSLHCLHSSPLYFSLPSLYSAILPCTFPQADIKAGPVGGRGLV